MEELLFAAINGNDKTEVLKILQHTSNTQSREIKAMAIRWATEQNRFSILISVMDVAQKSGRMEEICNILCTSDAEGLPVIFLSKSPEVAEILLSYLPTKHLCLESELTFLIHCIRRGIVINREVARKLKSQIGVRFRGKLPLEEGKNGEAMFRVCRSPLGNGEPP